jgi:hypothetical protein
VRANAHTGRSDIHSNTGSSPSAAQYKRSDGATDQPTRWEQRRQQSPSRIAACRIADEPQGPYEIERVNIRAQKLQTASHDGSALDLLAVEWPKVCIGGAEAN